jgi:flagellar hook-length control protein FliK
MLFQPDLICALPILPQIPVGTVEATPHPMPDFAAILQEITEVEPEAAAPDINAEVTDPEAEVISAPVAARLFVPELKYEGEPAIEVDRELDLPDVEPAIAPPKRGEVAQTATLNTPKPEMMEGLEQRSIVTTAPEPPADPSPTFAPPYQRINPIPIADPKPIFVPAQTVQNIAEQIVVSVANDDSGTTEIVLDPEELGRVRLHMTVTDQTVQIVIAAERPETSDLMRRHLDVLQQEFRSLGFQSVDLGFSDDSRENPSNGAPQPTYTAVEIAPDDTPQLVRLVSGGVDIRL